MPRYLIMITIGPVQEYIASARKLRDLWLGSSLLSELSKSVARALHQGGATLIFPHISSPSDLIEGSSLIVANKILGGMACASEEEVATLIRAAKEAWGEAREAIARESLELMHQIRGLVFDETRFNDQKMDAGEFFAAWAPLTDDYAASKKKVEGLLNGRKYLRDFKAPCWRGEGLGKSSLDGMRETVIGEHQEEIIGVIKKRERLDAMGCIKRFYPHKEGGGAVHFDDLSSVALIPYICGLGDGDLKLIEPFILGCCGDKSAKMDRASLIEKHALLFYLSKDELARRHALDSYTCMTRCLGKPPTYASILVGDGDEIGRALAAIHSEAGHRKFAEYLSYFAERVKTIVEDYKGSLIYAGGDDVMAYVPLHNTILCADAVRGSFSDIMEQLFEALNLPAPWPTFSIGVAVVHQKAPLDESLETARRALEKAKGVVGKNAFALIQTRRGKENLSIRGGWDRSLGEGIAGRLEAMCDFFKKGSLPSSLAFQLREIAMAAGDKLSFSTSASGGGLIPQNAASALVLKTILRKENGDLLPAFLPGEESILTLSDALIIAREIASAQMISEGGRS